MSNATRKAATMKVTVTWTNRNPNTIWNKLAAKLGRDPTNDEAIDEVKRLLTENTAAMADKGRLWFQR